MKKNTVKLNENTLRKMISENVKNVLNEGFFGNMFGKGHQAQAQQASQSQVSNPNATWYIIQWSKNLQGDDCFRLKNVETGEEYGWMDDGSPCRIMGKVIKNPNGNPIPHEDYHIKTFNMLRKFSTNGGQSQGVAQQAQTAVRESKSLVKINENTLKQIVAESVKKVLKEYVEGEQGGTDVYKCVPDTYVDYYLKANKYGDYSVLAGNQRNSMYPGKIVAVPTPEEAQLLSKSYGQCILKITASTEGVSQGRNCVLVDPDSVLNIERIA